MKLKEDDAVLAAVALKAIDLVNSWGSPIVKLRVNEEDADGDASVYLNNSEGRIFRAIVRPICNGSRFIDCDTWGPNIALEEFHCSSLDNYNMLVDEEIAKKVEPEATAPAM